MKLLRDQVINIHFNFKEPLNKKCKLLANKIDKNCADKIIKSVENAPAPIKITGYNPETFEGDASGTYGSILFWVNHWYEACGFDTSKIRMTEEGWLRAYIIYEEDFIEFFNVTNDSVIKPSDMDSFIPTKKSRKSSISKTPSKDEIGIIFHGEDHLSRIENVTGYIIKKQDIINWAKDLESSGILNEYYERSDWSNGGGPFDADLFTEQLFNDGDMIEPCEVGALHDAIDNNKIKYRETQVVAKYRLGYDEPELISPKTYISLFSEYISLY